MTDITFRRTGMYRLMACISFWIVVIGVMSSCVFSHKNNTSSGENVFHDSLKVDSMAEWKYPTLSSSLNTPALRSTYLVLHFWDEYKYDMCIKKMVLEQARVDYISFFDYVSSETIEQSLKSLFQEISKNDTVFNDWLVFFYDYLYYPNSIMRNDEHYLVFLNVLAQSGLMDKEQEIFYTKLIKIVSKNNIGSKAADFTLHLSDGSNCKMYDLAKSDYKLLFFNNPDCEDCLRIKELFTNNIEWKEWSENNYLTIVAVYTDSDFSLWKKTDYPQWWINGNDNQVINNKMLYDLKAIPTLYLLDKDNMVVLKDTSIEKVRMFLLQNIQ